MQDANTERMTGMRKYASVKLRSSKHKRPMPHKQPFVKHGRIESVLAWRHGIIEVPFRI